MSSSSLPTDLRPFADSVRFVAHDPAFADVTGRSPRLIKVVDTDAHEGPVYSSNEDALYFTTLPRPENVPIPNTPYVEIKRLALDGDRFPLTSEHVSVVRSSTNAANGMAVDLDGSLLVCEQGTRAEHARISRFYPATGAIETVVDAWSGLRFNSPNDIVVKSDDTIWFTDPAYGYLQGFKSKPQTGDYVYRYDPVAAHVSVVADSFNKPNGLAFSTNEETLYITDSGANQQPGSYYPALPHHIMAFDVRDGRHLANGRLFAVTTPGFPDGIKVDTEDRVYASCFGGVQIFNPSGDLVGEICLPGAVNFTFGGPDKNILFITTDDAIWAAVLAAKGV